MSAIVILAVFLFLAVVFIYRLVQAARAYRDAVAARKQAVFEAIRAVDRMVELVDQNLIDQNR